MICNNIITEHIALIILRNEILVIIVIDFDMCFKTSSKITLKKIITFAKYYLIQEEYKFSNTSHENLFVENNF